MTSKACSYKELRPIVNGPDVFKKGLKENDKLKVQIK